MNILITGNMGYIGPVLVRYLRKSIKDVKLYGYDVGFFGHCLTAASVLPENYCDQQYWGDVREFPDEILEKMDAVVMLAAVSNDPMGASFEEVTEQINYQSCAQIAEKALAHGIKRIVFASSCSMYGFAEGGPRKETDVLNPLTAYARSKVATEQSLEKLNLGDATVTSLRFSTACGMSPRLRLDLVLNDFVACALASGEITVLSDGTPWRPLIDVEDMARSIEWALTRENSQGGQYVAVNVGAAEWNYQVRDLAEAVVRRVPGTKLSINTDAPPDKRSYQVDFEKYRQIAPLHQPQVSLDQAIDRLKRGMEDMHFSDANFRNSQFMRLKVLEAHIEAGRLTSDLRWANL
jgi:nucleoside-diphosphate-sugar epimerase